MPAPSSSVLFPEIRSAPSKKLSRSRTATGKGATEVDRNAALEPKPAAIDTTLVSPRGTNNSPEELSPHATTVPSLFNARTWESPAAILVTLANPGGVEEKKPPHTTTVPLFFNTAAKSPPAAMATLLAPAETKVPRSIGVPMPQPATNPLFCKARLKYAPAAIATTPLRPGGTSNVCEKLYPQVTTVPSLFRARL